MKKITKIIISAISAISVAGLVGAFAITGNKKVEEENVQSEVDALQKYSTEQQKNNEEMLSYNNAPETTRTTKLQNNYNQQDSYAESFKSPYYNTLFHAVYNRDNLLIYNTLYVYLNNTLSTEQRSIFSTSVYFLNGLINSINSKYNIKTTTDLIENNSCVNVGASSSYDSRGSGVLAKTASYDDPNRNTTITFYNPAMNDAINKKLNQYSVVPDDFKTNTTNAIYSSTFIHEFMHFMGFDHNNSNNDYLMNATAYRYGAFSPAELLALFNYENKDEYNNTTDSNYFLNQRDKFLYLLKNNYCFYGDYSIDQNSYGDFENNQVISMSTKDGNKLILNGKYQGFYTMTSNGSEETGPFIVVEKNAKKSIILLDNTLKNIVSQHIENIPSETKIFEDLNYFIASQRIKQVDEKNLTVTSKLCYDGNVPYAVYNNIFDKLFGNKSYKNATANYYTYTATSSTQWKVNGNSYCEDTNEYLNNTNDKDNTL